MFMLFFVAIGALHNGRLETVAAFMFFAGSGERHGHREEDHMKTDCTTRKKAQENIARMLGVADYSTLVCATQDESKSIVLKAKSLKKHKASRIPAVLSSGNPYIMLHRLMDNRGKAIQ